MAALKLIEQKIIVEIRFPAYAPMFHVGADLAGHWLADGRVLSTNLAAAAYVVKDPINRFTVQFAIASATFDIEGESDFSEVLAKAAILAEHVKTYVRPRKIDRLGLRSYFLTSSLSFEEGKNKVTQTYFRHQQLPEILSPGAIKDVGVILTLRPPIASHGRLHFGPYDPETNLPAFAFQDHPVLLETRDGFMFDADCADADLQPSILGKGELTQWLSKAHAYNLDLVRGTLKSMGIE